MLPTPTHYHHRKYHRSNEIGRFSSIRKWQSLPCQNGHTIKVLGSNVCMCSLDIYYDRFSLALTSKKKSAYRDLAWSVIKANVFVVDILDTFFKDLTLLVAYFENQTAKNPPTPVKIYRSLKYRNFCAQRTLSYL